MIYIIEDDENIRNLVQVALNLSLIHISEPTRH